MIKNHFSVRAVVTGCAGCVILTMSSLYIALKLGALPWPIVFAALVSLFFIRKRGAGSLHEVNIAHTIMSAGAMTAGGLAFTLPGLFMLEPGAELRALPLFAIILGGTILGLIFSRVVRRRFIEKDALPFPMGRAAAETVIAGDEGGKKSLVLAVSTGIAGLWTLLRDAPGAFVGKTIIPASFLSGRMGAYGSLAGIWLSPMLISVGYIIGPVFICVWFAGALIGDFGILLGATKAGLVGTAAALKIKSSLGIGLMVGSGIGIALRGLISLLRSFAVKKDSARPGIEEKSEKKLRTVLFCLPIFAVLLFVFSEVCGIGGAQSVMTIAGAAGATALSALLVGQAGINPMEIFAIIAVLAVRAVSTLPVEAAFFVAGIVAVAAGLSGDIMNDFKAGHIMKTDYKAQWIAECAGGVLGAAVSLAVFFLLLRAYGPGAFGNPEIFPAPQAGAVAAMIGGIPHVPAFTAGLVAACILSSARLPVVTLGLGVYLPFYLSATAFLGVIGRFIVRKSAPSFRAGGLDIVAASGALGGEAIVGVLIAMVLAARAVL